MAERTIETAFAHGRKAIELLEDPRKYPGLPDRRSEKILRFWMYPAFEPYRSWTIIREGHKDFYVRRLIWDQHVTTGSEPQTFGSEAPIPLNDYCHIVNGMKEITIRPLVLTGIVGLDGVTYGVEVDTFGLCARFSWWVSAPDEWKAMENWHREAIGLLDSYLPRNTYW